MKKPNKPQDRIEKLKGLAKPIECGEQVQDIMDDVYRSQFPKDIITQAPTINQINVKAIIKLNEELTAENSRLLTELEHAEKDFVDKSIQSANRLVRINELESELKNEVHNWAKEVDAKTDLQIELQSIKSKWWYKLITWGW